MSAYVTLEHLDVGYHGKALIRDINLGIAKGEIVTLIGPNGAGKSTILKSLTRQLSLVGGKASIDGKAIHAFSHKEFSTCVAVVLTERLSPEMMTCRDVVSMGRYPYTGHLGLLSKADEAKVDEAMASVRVLELADQDFNAISDGQRQRVLLARAVCQEPEIIILDEPTSYLDIRHKLELLTMLRQMARERQITVIMSLHEIDLAMKVSDRLVCVSGETIFRYGKPDEIVTDEAVRALYQIELGSFNSLFGSTELARPQGTPKVLVLSNNGSGVAVYRRLQKENQPFIAAVVYKNDMDYAVAAELAARIITEEPFADISDAAYDAVLEAVETVNTVIDAGLVFGSGNSRLKEILAYAEKVGKLCREVSHE